MKDIYVPARLCRSTLTALMLIYVALPALAGSPQQKQDKTDRAPAPTSGRTRAGEPKPSASKLIDVNSASKEELKSLPGIGDVMAQKIIDGRSYRSKRDLLTRKILPASAYNRISDRIVARQAKSEPTGSLIPAQTQLAQARLYPLGRNAPRSLTHLTKGETRWQIKVQGIIQAILNR